MHKSLPQSLYSRQLLKSITMVTALSLAVFAAACKRSGAEDRSLSPMAALRATMEAAKRGDWEVYKRGLSQATLKQDEENAKREGLSLEEKYQKAFAKLTIPQMRNEKIDGDTATLEVSYDSLGTQWLILPFVKENGEWKIARERYGEVALFPGQKPTRPKKTLLPVPTGYTNDFANVIDSESKKRLEEILNRLKARRGVEFFVATVKTTSGTPIADYTRDVLEDWDIRGKRSGLLLLLAVDDRKYQFELSNQLGDELPNGFLKQSGQLMVSSFRQGKYGEGLLKSVNAIIVKLEEQNTGVSPKSDGNKSQ